MCDSDQIKKKEEEKFKISLENRKFEIELFWKRSLFFWGFIASSFIAFANLSKNNSEYTILVANFGMVCSFAWTLANRGSKYWQDNWEDKLFNNEKYLEAGFFSKPISNQNKCIFSYTKRFSVSKLAIALSDFTVGIWLIIVIAKISESWMSAKTSSVVFSLLSIFYMIL